MAHPLESAYNWRLLVAVSSVGVVLCIALLARSQAVGWLSAAIVLLVCWVIFMVVVWIRTQAYLMVDGDTLTVRTFRTLHQIKGSDVIAMSQVLTPSGPSYKIRVRAEDGESRRYGAPTALLRRGHSTLFRWILTWAPHAELDKGSRRTLQTLRERGALPYPDDDQAGLRADSATDEQTKRDDRA